MCLQGRPRGQGRPQGLHLGFKRIDLEHDLCNHSFIDLVEASHAKVTHVPLPCSHIFGFNLTFCHGIVVSCVAVVIVLSFQLPHPGSIRAWVANAWNGRI